MREQTAQAHGGNHKGGAVRRIAVTMDENLFEQLKARAVESGRSLSDQIMQCLTPALRRDGEWD